MDQAAREALAFFIASQNRCPVCGSDRAACPTLEAATPQPGRWCPLFEDALEVREWRRWAYRYRKSERNASPGYRAYRERKFKILRQRGATVAALRAIVQASGDDQGGQ
jgi:hypothetical protein